MDGLKGKIAIVTGAAQGLGQAIALRLLREGASVLAVDQSAAGLAALEKSDNADTLTMDLTAEDAPRRIIAYCCDRFSTIDILVNNAGVGNAPALHNTTDKILDFQLNINLRVAFRLSRDVLPVLRRTQGNIVNITSSVALAGYKNSAAYSAAKAGIIGLTRNMAAEYGPDGIRVNAVAPGVIASPLTAERLKTPRFRALVVGTMPLGKVGEPDDVAAAVAFLSSTEARMITGQVLAIDGGQTASVFINETMLASWETSVTERGGLL